MKSNSWNPPEPKPSLDDVVRRAKARNVALPPLTVRRARRVAASLTQSDVGLVLGRDRATVSRYETGTREPRGSDREVYAAILRSLGGGRSDV